MYRMSREEGLQFLELRKKYIKEVKEVYDCLKDYTLVERYKKTMASVLSASSIEALNTCYSTFKEESKDITN